MSKTKCDGEACLPVWCRNIGSLYGFTGRGTVYHFALTDVNSAKRGFFIRFCREIHDIAGLYAVINGIFAPFDLLAYLTRAVHITVFAENIVYKTRVIEAF